MSRDRMHWLTKIGELDPAVEYEQIMRIVTQHEFPWDMYQSLSFALFRTYAVPSIGELLYQTGEFTERTQKRHDDTVLVLEAPGCYGLTSPQGREGIKRMNQMHGMYSISNDDMRYVLSTFVVCPIRWLDVYGWRKLTEPEKVASANFYRHLGKLMNIKEIPETWVEFSEFCDEYEAKNFGFNQSARKVADATLGLMTTFFPSNTMPKPVALKFAYALMDDRLLTAFNFPKPSKLERKLAANALQARGKALRGFPPRMKPFESKDLSQIRSYPDGFEVMKLGTFVPAPGVCPVSEAANAPKSTVAVGK